MPPSWPCRSSPSPMPSWRTAGDVPCELARQVDGRMLASSSSADRLRRRARCGGGRCARWWSSTHRDAVRARRRCDEPQALALCRLRAAKAATPISVLVADGRAVGAGRRLLLARRLVGDSIRAVDACCRRPGVGSDQRHRTIGVRVSAIRGDGAVQRWPAVVPTPISRLRRRDNRPGRLFRTTVDTTWMGRLPGEPASTVVDVRDGVRVVRRNIRHAACGRLGRRFRCEA
jgi:hypothetical protein